MLTSRLDADQNDGLRIGFQLLCIAVVAGHSATVRAEDSTAQATVAQATVAVIADRSAIDTGIPDLLTAELGQVENVQLVERAAIADILREQQLASALNPGGTAQRLQLGKLLKADLLVLLRVVKSAKEQHLSFTISETSVGARLRTEFLSISSRDPDLIAVECRELFQQTQRHFRDGMKHLIAVLPFESNNLVHDFDALQTAYPALLQSALMRVPGVAVLETDEAHTIRGELELTGEQLPGEQRQRRRVPLLVQGEYKVNRDDGSVALRVSLLDGDRERRRIALQGLKQDDVVELLTGQLVSELIELTESTDLKPLSRRAQFNALARRASQLSGVGEYGLALPLREAALLVTPDSFAQRVYSLYDFVMQWTAGPYAGWQQVIDPEKTDQETADELEARLDSMRIAFGHLEFLTAHDLINLREAAILLSSANRRIVKLQQAVNPITGRHGYDEWKPLMWRITDRCMELDPALRNGAIHPLIRRFPGSSDSKPADEWSHQAQFELFWNHAGELLLKRPAYDSPDKYDWQTWRLSELRRLMPVLSRQSIMSASMVRRFAHFDRRSSQPTPWFFDSALASERHRNALRDTALTFVQGDGLSSLYGKWILLGLELQLGVSTKNFDVLRRRVQKLGDKTRPHILAVSAGEQREVAVFPYELEPLLRGHMPKLVASRPGVLLPSGNVRPSPLAGKQHLPPRNPIPQRDPNPRVTFRRLDVPSLWSGMQKCTDKLDVYWNPTTAEVMSQPGELHTIYRQGTREEQIAGLHWDGENFWIATIGAGIHLVSPDGLSLGVLPPDVRLAPDEQGVAADAGKSARIPPYNPPVNLVPQGRSVEHLLSGYQKHQGNLRLHPVAPGRCIAWGRYGPRNRLWFAEIRFTPDGDREDAFRVRVFHTATRVASRNPTAEENQDVSLIFNLLWRSEMTLDERRVLLIGRGDGRSPLAIDIDSLETRLIPLSISEEPGFIADEDIVSMNSWGLQHYARSEDEQTWSTQRILNNRFGTRVRNEFLKWQGAWHNPGARWTRIEPKTLELESLCTVDMPRSQQFRHYGVSAHYGLVAWNPGDVLHHVLIDADAAPADVDSEFGFIPAEFREKHAQAVAEIRRNGGFVDSDWARHRANSQVRFDGPMWKTFVFLPADWRGGDQGLALLDELYNLIDLYLVKTPVTNKAMPHIGRVRSLQRLYLVDTEITDAGLKELWDLRRLIYIRLDGPADGSHFSDAGLKHLFVLPLKIATLYGAGFTDEAIPILQTFRTVSAVHSLETGISPGAQQKLRINGRDVRWSKVIPSSNEY